MTVSSRTPECLSFRCTLCGWEGRLEPSPPGHDAPCPSCGALLWVSRQRGSSLHWHSALAWLWPVLLTLAAAAVMTVLATTVGGLGWPERVVLVLLTVLLFGRGLPRLARWLGRKIAGGV